MSDQQDPSASVTVKLRIKKSVHAEVKDAAEQNGMSMNAEIAHRIEAAPRDQDALDRAMVFSYGADNGPLLYLFGEVLRVVAPRGAEWFEDEAALREVAAGLVQLLRRLRAPDDGTVASGGIERRIDDLLFDLGYDGAEDRAENTPRSRRAAEKRRRFGIYGPLLVRYRRAVQKILLDQPPREMRKPAPEIAASWDRIGEINARKEEAEGEGA